MNPHLFLQYGNSPVPIHRGGAFPSVSLLEPMVRFTVSECSWPSCAAQKANFHQGIKSSTWHQSYIHVQQGISGNSNHLFSPMFTIECHWGWLDSCELWHELWRPERIDGNFLRWPWFKSRVNPLPSPWVLSSINGWFFMAMLPEGTWQMAIVWDCFIMWFITWWLNLGNSLLVTLTSSGLSGKSIQPKKTLNQVDLVCMCCKICTVCMLLSFNICNPIWFYSNHIRWW